MADACRDPAILRFTFMQEGFTQAEAVQWIDRANERWSDGHPLFAIVDPWDDRLLGEVGLNVNARHISAEGHYWVPASDRQRWVASRALGLVADWGFSNGIERLFLVIHPENVASNRLAERVGFTSEGILRSYEPIEGERPDMVSWSLLSGDARPWHYSLPEPCRAIRAAHQVMGGDGATAQIFGRALVLPLPRLRRRAVRQE